MRHTKIIDNVTPVCLNSIPVAESSQFIVIGQGSLSEDDPGMQPVMYEVDVSWKTCNGYENKYMSDNMFCATNEGKDSCYVL